MDETTEEVALPDVKLDRLVAQGTMLAKSFNDQASLEPLEERSLRHLVADYIEATESWRHKVAIGRTLLQLTGRPFPPSTAERTAWQLVGRTYSIGDNNPLTLFDVPTAHGWSAVEILKTSPDTWPDGRFATVLTLFVLTGTAAGFQVTKKVPEGWLSYLARHIGYNRRMLYQDDPQYLIGLRFWAFLSSAEGQGLDLKNWQIDDKTLTRNRKILSLRHRDEITREVLCPNDLEVECLKCTKLPHECPASLLRRSAPSPAVVRTRKAYD